MAGFLKKMFSFGKKEVIETPAETPGLRTDGEELQPINWAALRDLTRDDEAEKVAAEDAAAAKAAEEAEAARVAGQAASKAAEEAVARAAEEAAREAERRAREAEAAAKAEAERVEKAEADRLAAEIAARAAEAEEAAKAKAAEEAQAATEAAQRADARETAKKLEAEKAEAERLAVEAAAREATAKAEAKAVEEAHAAREAAKRAEAAAREAAAKTEAYNPGLVTGGDELLAPSWMTQPEEPAKPEPAPAPVPSADPTNKVTVAKKVEQKTAPAAPAPEPKLPWFQRLRMGLLKSSRELSSNIAGVFTKRKLDEDTLQDLEDVLLRADLGMEIAMRVTDTLAANRYGKEISDFEVRTVMGAEIEKVLTPVAMPLELDLSHKPHVILVVGVNGTGKTTTIGKLAAKLKEGGLDVMLAAGDTFRAAAIEQLKIWGERTGAPVISSKLGADAASLAYDAFEQAKAAGSDVLIIDTAGRLQNKTELMAELEKIVRVLGKLDPDAPHTVLQTIDATTGQNALNQVEIFRNIAGVNGLVLTKLDGTARGGILVAIAAKHKLPVYFIGVGEQVDDLEPFVAGDFAKAIAGVG